MRKLRVYGWGLSLDILTALCFRLGGARGYLSALNPGTAPASVDGVKDCRWVVFWSPSSPSADSAFQSLGYSPTSPTQSGPGGGEGDIDEESKSLASFIVEQKQKNLPVIQK